MVGMMSRRTVTWLTWSICGLSLALTAVSLLLLRLNFSHPGVPIWDYWIPNTLLAVGLSPVGAVLAPRLSPKNPMGWLFCAMGFLAGVTHFSAQYAIYTLLAAPAGSLPAGEVAAWMLSWVWILPTGLSVFLFLLFPGGRLPSRRWRWFAWLSLLLTLVGTISQMLAPGLVLGIGGIYNPLGVEGLPNIWELIQRLLFALMFISVGSLFVRQLRTSGVERQQLKWFTYAATLSIGGIILTYTISHAIDSMWLGRAGQVIMIVGALGTPIAMGIAILRYRLYDIDVVINRTLVYGVLTASVIGIYVLVVGYLGTLFQMDDLFVSLLATGLVAVLFAPLRDRLQRGVNRLMYGERDDPYAVLSRLGERVEATLAPDDVLLTIVKTVREALKLPYAAIALPRDGTGFEVVATSGEKPPVDPLVLLLSYGGEPVGELLLAPRAPGESFSTADRRLFDSLARHAGVAVHGVHVMADLRRSRERLVLAREEERRRLRSDLHDELAPTLAALGLSAATVGELIPTDPKGAAFANEKLRVAIRATVGDVRRLVYDLRPPALDELGLIEAIRERASRYGVGEEGFRATVEASDELPALPAAVEVAAYRIVQEALMNVSRHARASTCAVRLACTDSPSQALTIEVIDDGVGLPERPEGGVGLRSMRERAAELGGECGIVRYWPSGTRVFAWLPFKEPLLEGSKEE